MVKFVEEHKDDNVQTLALQRNRYPEMTDTEFLYLLQQIEGRQHVKRKLPSIYEKANWEYPVRLSLEQCSSETTAKYKTNLVSGTKLIDLTGGFGIDCYFMSQGFKTADYIEQNAALCEIARHNFEQYAPQISVHNTTAESYLESARKVENTTLFIDPARRNKVGGKVFKIEDCEPNILDLMPKMKAIAEQIVIKLSPMLDLTAAIKSIQPSEVHIVAVDDEVKELLLILHKEPCEEPTLKAVNITRKRTETIAFKPSEETEAIIVFVKELGNGYIYEPNAALLKAGAFKYVGEKYHLQKLASNTHLYYSEEFVTDFAGRIFKIANGNIKATKAASIITRNYPESADQMRKRLKMKEDDIKYIIGTTIGTKKALILAERIQ